MMNSDRYSVTLIKFILRDTKFLFENLNIYPKKTRIFKTSSSRQFQSVKWQSFILMIV